MQCENYVSDDLHELHLVLCMHLLLLDNLLIFDGEYRVAVCNLHEG